MDRYSARTRAGATTVAARPTKGSRDARRNTTPDRFASKTIHHAGRMTISMVVTATLVVAGGGFLPGASSAFAASSAPTHGATTCAVAGDECSDAINYANAHDGGGSSVLAVEADTEAHGGTVAHRVFDIRVQTNTGVYVEHVFRNDEPPYTDGIWWQSRAENQSPSAANPPAGGSGASTDKSPDSADSPDRTSPDASADQPAPGNGTVGVADTSTGKGYWIANVNGTVQAYGDAANLGGHPNPPSPIAAIAGAPNGMGYWLVTQTGSVYAFGSAVYHGGITAALNAPIVAMAADPATGGYWLLGADGGVFAFDAPFLGSTGDLHLNAPAIAMAATPNGGGYYLSAEDGGVFAYGDAKFQGSMSSDHLDQPVVGMSVDPATGGYWLDAADGGVFAFGAPFHGSTADTHLNAQVIAMVATSHGNGYRLAGADGGIFSFGDAGFYGSDT